MKINFNLRLFAATNFDAAQYVASPAYGVNRFMLDRTGNEKARATTIVEYQANSMFASQAYAHWWREISGTVEVAAFALEATHCNCI